MSDEHGHARAITLHTYIRWRVPGTLVIPHVTIYNTPTGKVPFEYSNHTPTCTVMQDAAVFLPQVQGPLGEKHFEFYIAIMDIQFTRDSRSER